jgi:hypothetical protein
MASTTFISTAKPIRTKNCRARRMTLDTLERLGDTYLYILYSDPQSSFIFQGGEPAAGRAVLL